MTKKLLNFGRLVAQAAPEQESERGAGGLMSTARDDMSPLVADPSPQADTLLPVPGNLSDRLVEALPAAVYVCDLAGRIVRYNRRAAELWGRSPQLGDPDHRFCGSLRLFWPDGRPLAHGETPMAEVLRTGRPVCDQEIVIERPDGSRIFVLVNIEPLSDGNGDRVGAVNCFLDITARKEAEKAAQRSRQELEDFFQNATVALHRIAADGTILRANRAELDLLGYAAEDYIGHNVREFHVDRAAIDDIIARLSRGEHLLNYEARLRARDGSIRHVLISSTAHFQDGVFDHTRCFTVDVTERRNLETRLALAKDAGGVGTFDRAMPTGRLRVSDTYWRLFGVEKDGFPPTYDGWLSRVHPDDRSRVVDDLDRAFESGVVETEYRVVWPNGEVHWLQTRGRAEQGPDGGALRIIGAIIDVTERKRIEEELRRRESELRLITDSVPALIGYVDADRRYRFVNRAYEDWFGQRRDEMEGRHMSDVLGEALYALVHPTIDAVLAGEAVHFERAWPHHDGTMRHIEGDYLPRSGADGATVGFYIFINDVTDRRKAEEGMRARTRELETVMNTVPAAVWLTTERDVSHIVGSRYASHLFRTEPGKNLSRTPRDGEAPTHWRYFKDGVEMPIGESPLRRAIRGDVTYGEELELVFDDGTRTPLLLNATPIYDASGNTIGAVAAGMDITDRKRAEEALRERTAELESVMATVPAIVWLARGRNGERIESSRYGADLLRMKPGDNQSLTAPSDEMPVHFRVLKNGVEVQPVDLPVQRAARGETVRGEEVEIAFSDGTSITVLIHAVPLRGANGSPVGSVAAAVDIGERKRAEERLKLVAAELDHRVRNTLGMIRSMLRMTATVASNKEELVGAVTGRIEAMARAHGLLTRTGWRGAGLRSLVTDELAPYAGSSRSTVSTDGPDILLRPSAAVSIALVIHELITNAAKYGALSQPTGTVRVSWRIEGSAEEQRLHLEWIERGGPLVSPPVRRGFGSAILNRALAHEFGATVRIDFAPPGLSFVATAPLSRLIAPADTELTGFSGTTAEPGAALPSDLAGARVLVVEDEVLIALDLHDRLAALGADVIGPVGRLDDALALAEATGIDIALLDVNIGGGSIFPVADRLAERGIPFAFLTGYNVHSAFPERFRNAAVLHKPFSESAIAEMLGTLVQRSRLDGRRAEFPTA